MADIVERLRAVHDHDFGVSFLAHTADTAGEAASEIERLRLKLASYEAGAALGIAGPLTMKPNPNRDGAQPLPTTR